MELSRPAVTIKGRTINCDKLYCWEHLVPDFSLVTVKRRQRQVKAADGGCPFVCSHLLLMSLWYGENSPERLDDIRGDGCSSLVGVGLPGQWNAVLGNICDYGFVWRTWQLERLCGLSHWWVCALWMVREWKAEKKTKKQSVHVRLKCNILCYGASPVLHECLLFSCLKFMHVQTSEFASCQATAGGSGF